MSILGNKTPVEQMETADLLLLLVEGGKRVECLEEARQRIGSMGWYLGVEFDPTERDETLKKMEAAKTEINRRIPKV